MIHPESVVRLATEVVCSWASKRSNYIIVAPPLSEPHRVFQLLADTEFQHRVLEKRADRLAVARIGQSDFRSHTRLATAVLDGWGLSDKVTIDPEYPLGALELALELLKEREGIPVVLVDRFHDAIKWIDGDFGITLRDLENDHFLKTVVAIPVSLEELQRRANADPKGSLFLQSDWGQGHREKMLKGYSESEVAVLLKENAYGEEFAKLMYRATAGLPDLVDRLHDEIGTMNPNSFEHFLRAESSSRCSRLLDWLDCSGEDLYQRLAAESLSRNDVRIRGTSLADHSWADMLLKKDGSFNCLMLGWASIEQLSRAHNRAFIDVITDHARSRRFSHVEALLPSARNANNPDGEIWKALMIVNRFCCSTDVYQREWSESRRCLLEIIQLAKHSANEHIQQAADKLSQWAPLTDLMCEYFSRKKTRKDVRLEEFVCQQKTQDAFTAFLQLHQLRLQMAANLDPLPAMKSVIELPESLMQVFGFYKFELQFWNFQGIVEDERKMIEELLKRPFTSPPKGQRLSFHALLWLSHAKAENAKLDDRLFGCPSDLLALEEQYQARCEQVHSASFVSSVDWNSYRCSCLEFIELVAKDVLGEKLVAALPDPAQCFCDLLNVLQDVPRSK